jgi:hypothetical protein
MRNVVGVSESPFTLIQQIYLHPGARWEITVTLNPLPPGPGDEWRAWLASLQGRYGTFLMGDPTRQTARGIAGGTPKVRVDSQTGSTLDFYDASTTVSSWLLPGDYIQVGSASSSHIHRVLAKVTTNDSGAGLVDIWPPLRTSPASGDVLYVSSTSGLWRLSENSIAEEIIAPGIFRVSFSAMESL